MIVFTDTRCLEHQAPGGYPECPERLSSMVDHLRREGFTFAEDKLIAAASSAAPGALRAVHDGDYVDRFQRAVKRGDGLLDSADNPLSSGTWSAAMAAVEASLAAADWVMRPATSPPAADRCAFVAGRPPGHHAEKSTAMGFCFFNNVAIAAQHLLDRHRCERVAIVDIDVHHGNGTQHLFEDRADVFFVSLHQFPFYPGTGAESETGTGEGEGATLNIPLAAASDDDRYRKALDEQVLPALRKFAPEVLLISAGFDAWAGDPLGGMRVSEAGFEAWGRSLRQVADEVAGGRLLALLEGGYDLAAVPRLAARFLRGIDASA